MRSVFDAWSDRVFLRALDDSGVPVSGMLWAFLRDAIVSAKLLGISERTLDRMVKLKGYPEVRLRARKGLKPRYSCSWLTTGEVRLRARKGLKPEPVVNPDDVARMMEDGKRAVVMPRETALQLRRRRNAANRV